VRKFSLLFLLLFAINCRPKSRVFRTQDLKVIYLKDKKLYVLTANNPTEWQQGLKYYTSLPDSVGMLFIFPEETPLSFWMKDTPMDLSIAYIDKKGVIFEIHDLKAFDETPVESKSPGQFALEVNRGWFERNNIKIGDTVIIPWLK